MLIGLPVSAAHAKTPTELRDLIGTPLDGSEYELLERGFINLNRLTWWNDKTRTCVKLRAVKGNLVSLNTVAAKACHLD